MPPPWWRLGILRIRFLNGLCHRFPDRLRRDRTSVLDCRLPRRAAPGDRPGCGRARRRRCGDARSAGARHRDDDPTTPAAAGDVGRAGTLPARLGARPCLAGRPLPRARRRRTPWAAGSVRTDRPHAPVGVALRGDDVGRRKLERSTLPRARCAGPHRHLLGRPAPHRVRLASRHAAARPGAAPPLPPAGAGRGAGRAARAGRGGRHEQAARAAPARDRA